MRIRKLHQVFKTLDDDTIQTRNTVLLVMSTTDHLESIKLLKIMLTRVSLLTLVYLTIGGSLGNKTTVKIKPMYVQQEF